MDYRGLPGIFIMISGAIMYATCLAMVKPNQKSKRLITLILYKKMIMIVIISMTGLQSGGTILIFGGGSILIFGGGSILIFGGGADLDIWWGQYLDIWWGKYLDIWWGAVS